MSIPAGVWPGSTVKNLGLRVKGGGWRVEGGGLETSVTLWLAVSVFQSPVCIQVHYWYSTPLHATIAKSIACR